MRHTRAHHRKIKRLHEICFRIIHFDETSSEVLLETDDSVSIRNINLQLLAIKMYKTSKGLSPPIKSELYENRNEHQHNLRHNSEFAIPAVNSVYRGTESVSFLGLKIWI